MRGWPTVALGDAPLEILDGDRGAEYPKKGDFLPSGDWLFLDTGNVRKDGFEFDAVQFIDKAKEAKLRKGRLSRFDIVITTRGTIGNVGFYNANVPYDKIRINSGMVILRAAGEKLEPAYLFQVVRSPHFRGQAKAIASGSAQPQLPIRDMKAITIPLPPLAAQQAISRVLSSYDDLIENNTRRIAILEEMARRMFEEWFVHFRAPGCEGLPLVESDLGPIPKGWRVGRLDDLARMDATTLDPRRAPDEMFAHFSYPAFDQARLPSFELGSTIMSNKFVFQAPCVLVGKLNPRIKRIWYVRNNEGSRSITSTEFLPMRSVDSESLPFLLSLLNSTGFGDCLKSLTGGTSTSHQRANPKNVMSLPTLLPPIEVRRAFSVIACGYGNLADVLHRANHNLRAQRDLLLPKLISGEIDVADAAPILEAAE